VDDQNCPENTKTENQSLKQTWEQRKLC